MLEIVLDGLDFRSIASAMRTGIDAACRPGVRSITAGNYGGKLGPYHFHLHKIMSGDLDERRRRWPAPRRPPNAPVKENAN